MSVFIFDFDGTLADTFPLVVDVTYELSGAPRLPQSKVAELRSLPMLSAVMRLGVHPWQVPKLIWWTRRRMFSRMQEVAAFPGIVETIHELALDGHRLYVLTSNRRQNVEVFLQTHRLARYFEDVVSVYYGNAFYKVYGLRRLLARDKIKAADCYYVGNEVLDLHAAAHVGVRGIGTTWSGHARAVLAAAKPFAIIDTPKELLELDDGSND